MVLNNGFAERAGKIKLNDTYASNVLNKYQDNSDILFSVTATGLDLHYQWQIKNKDTNDWDDIADATLPKLRGYLISPEDDGSIFRCKIYNKAGVVYTDEVTLTVNQPTTPPVISTQPTSVVSKATKMMSDVYQEKAAKVQISI